MRRNDTAQPRLLRNCGVRALRLLRQLRREPLGRRLDLDELLVELLGLGLGLGGLGVQPRDHSLVRG